METLSITPILLYFLTAPAAPSGIGSGTVLLIVIIIFVVIVILRRIRQKKEADRELKREGEKLIYRVCNSKLKTKFKLSGWDHLDYDASEIQRRVQVGEKLELVADPDNKYDPIAIRVLKDNTQIGWFSRKSKKQLEVFIVVCEGKEVDVEVVDIFPMKIKVTYMPKV